MIVIAHRGANREALENSWQAFEKAVDSGADRIELDIQLTKDDQPAIIHDSSLVRTTNRTEKIAELLRIDIDRHCRLVNGEHVPFLDEVLSVLGTRIELNIEIKDSGSRAAEIVARQIHTSTARLKRIIISSFFPSPLLYLRENYPDLERACLWGDVCDWSSMSHFAPPVFMQLAGSTIWHPWVKYLDQTSMDYAKSKNWIVYPYCDMRAEESNRIALWTRMRSLQIEGLCTNYPREFRRWLNSDLQTSALNLPRA